MGMPNPVRRGLDRQAADVLIARGGRFRRRWRFSLRRAAEPGEDDVAIETVLKASQQLALSDPAGAASLIQRGTRTRARSVIRFEVLSSSSARSASLFAAGLAGGVGNCCRLRAPQNSAHDRREATGPVERR